MDIDVLAREISVVVPHPSVARYWAIVVVKPPELEKSATEPLINTSSGLSPPSAPPIRTRFQIRHAQRIRPKNIDAIGLTQSSNFARIVDGDFFRHHHDLFQTGIDSDQLGYTVANAGRWQINDAQLKEKPASRPSRTLLKTGISPIGVGRTWPRRPGDVPNTTLPPENA